MIMDNLHVKKLSLINFKGLKEISFDFDKRIIYYINR